MTHRENQTDRQIVQLAGRRRLCFLVPVLVRTLRWCLTMLAFSGCFTAESISAGVIADSIAASEQNRCSEATRFGTSWEIETGAMEGTHVDETWDPNVAFGADDPEASIDRVDVVELEPWISWQVDADAALPTMCQDVLSICTWENALILGAGAAKAIITRNEFDSSVRSYTAEHPLRWGEGSRVLRQFGEIQYQIPAILAVYGWSVWQQEDQLHEFSKALISAYTITTVTTLAIKGATNTQRPTDTYQNGHYGFPSFHAASTFTIAAVIDEYYGWPAGLPAYAVAGLVGWSRIDQREHDLSDVLFGAILGYVVGRSVAAAHIERYSGFRVAPYYDSTSNSIGTMFHLAF